MPLKFEDFNETTVQDYSFSQFSEEIKDDGVKEFEIKELTEHREKVEKEIKPILLQEGKNAEETMFKISPIVEKFRGIKKATDQELLNKIENEVQEKIELVKKEAYEEGLKRGEAEGKSQTLEGLKGEVDKKLNSLEVMLVDTLHRQENLLDQQKIEIYQLVKTLTRWVILRELKDDGKYLERLLEKLLQELNQKSNLLLTVGEVSFSEMPDVLEALTKKFQDMKNIRLELDRDLKSRGVVVESENGILVGTLETQLKSLDRLFDPILEEISDRKNGET